MCGEHPLVEIFEDGQAITAWKIEIRSFMFLPLSLWRKQNVFEGMILAYFRPPIFLFFLTQRNKRSYYTLDEIDRPNNLQAF